VDAPKNKEVVLALREIAAGLVDFDSIGQIEPDELAAEALLEQEEAETEATAQEAADETPPQPEQVDEGEEDEED